MADSLTRASLTSREIEVLQLVVTGESNKAIARHLHIELGTVKSHMSAIMTKLDATSRTQAAGIATTRGLVEDPMLAQRVPRVPRASTIELRAQFA
jgi:two-component system NarL family response regulator